MLKGFKDFINEGKKIGELYHYTSLENLISILKTNLLKGSISYEDAEDYERMDIKYNAKPFVSLTRNKNFHKLIDLEDNDIKFEIRIELDGDLLSNKYLIKPFEFDNFSVGDEFEERIWFLNNQKGVEDIKRYIKKITIFDYLFKVMDLSSFNFLKRYLKEDFKIEDFEKLSKRKNILNSIKSKLEKEYSLEVEIDIENIKDYYEEHIDFLDVESKNKIYKRGKYKI